MIQTDHRGLDHSGGSKTSEVYINNLSTEPRAFAGTFNTGGERNEEVRTLQGPGYRQQERSYHFLGRETLLAMVLTFQVEDKSSCYRRA